jgi:hypothetical protein
MMLCEWVLSKLQDVKLFPRVLVRDPLGMIDDAYGEINNYARDNGFTVIMAATNLAFRDLYEKATADPVVSKLLVIDRSPIRRRSNSSMTKAPPVFYPDLLAIAPQEARLDLDLRQFLREKTGDPDWPAEANNPQYARIILRHLDGVLRAHTNLRRANEGRFTDDDFKRIVAFAALGVAEAAFKKLDDQDYWKIGLLRQETLDQLDSLAPDISRPIRDELRKAPAPFCWFGIRDTDLIIRAFYLSLVLSQHFDNWSLLLANIDQQLAPYSGIRPEILADSAPGLIAMDRNQARRDLEEAEQSLDADALRLLLLENLQINKADSFLKVLEKERFSQVFRSLALLQALDHLLSGQAPQGVHKKVAKLLFPDGNSGPEPGFVDAIPSDVWEDLREAYGLALNVLAIRKDLALLLKSLQVMKCEQLTYQFFWDYWNTKKINRLEYYLSSLERLVESGKLIPHLQHGLPSEFHNCLARIRDKVRSFSNDVTQRLGEVNSYWQAMVAARYQEWITGDDDVYLTSQYLRRCLKPNWDCQKEKAVLLIFDGMRYDIWDELLKPVLRDRLEIIQEWPGSSLIPSETHVSRKAISAGSYPDAFDMGAPENKLLQEALSRDLGYSVEVDVLTPAGSGIGETVHYRAGNLEVYIFELCDKSLHNIQMKTLPDGRTVSTRPLSFIYQQLIKNIIDIEVMSIIQSLAAGTKVFVVADHGFGQVARQPLWFSEQDLNEPRDCSYLNCYLKTSLAQADLPSKVRHNVVAFTPGQLRMPTEESRMDQKTGQLKRKHYETILFPKPGYSFSRNGAHYNPDAYSHGGISLQEMLIPMAVLRVRARDEGLLSVGAIICPQNLIEDKEAEFKLHLSLNQHSGNGEQDLRVDAEASYAHDLEQKPLHQIIYVTTQGTDLVFRFVPDTAGATDDERLKGIMGRTLSITMSYREGYRTVHKSRVHNFTVQLNSDKIIRRVPSHLGNILGLTPKSMR